MPDAGPAIQLDRSGKMGLPSSLDYEKHRSEAMSQAIRQTNHLFPRLKFALISIWATNWRKITKFGLCLVIGPVDWPLKKLKGPIPVPARLPGPGAGYPARPGPARPA